MYEIKCQNFFGGKKKGRAFMFHDLKFMKSRTMQE